MTKQVMLEVALNGPWTTRRQPRIPVTPHAIIDEAAECARLGAAIVHLHAYDTTGAPRDTYELYAPIFEAIKSRVDVVCYPTIPIAVGASQRAGQASARYAAVRKLAQARLIEWAVVDPGALHIATLDELERDENGFLYANSPQDVREGLRTCAAHGLVPSFAIYEPGFLRAGAAIRRLAGIGGARPVYRFMFSNTFTFGLPPSEASIDTYRAMLDAFDPGAPWMLAGLGADLSSLWAATVARGGHVRVGLEDAPLGIESSNVNLTTAAVRALEGLGATLATAKSARENTLGDSHHHGTI